MLAPRGRRALSRLPGEDSAAPTAGLSCTGPAQGGFQARVLWVARPPAACFDLVPDGSWLYWRGWGRQTVNRPASRRERPRVSGRHHELCGAQSQAWRGGTRWGRGGHPHLGRLALWGAVAWAMQTEPWPWEAGDLEHPGSASGNPWTDYLSSLSLKGHHLLWAW